MPDDARVLVRLAGGIKKYDVRMFLVHAGGGMSAKPTALCPGVKTAGSSALSEILETPGKPEKKPR